MRKTGDGEGWASEIKKICLMRFFDEASLELSMKFIIQLKFYIFMKVYGYWVTDGQMRVVQSVWCEGR